MAKDYYRTLGLSREASDDDIKKAYRKMAMLYHPDRNPGKEKWANEKFKEINEAYAILGDPEKRRQYDQFGMVGDAGQVFGSPYTRTTFEDVVNEFGGSGLGYDFLDQIFGDSLRGFSFKTYRGGPGARGRPSGARVEEVDLEELLKRAYQEPRDVNYEIAITRHQAAHGLEKDLTRKGRTLRVKIPAGSKSGTIIRLRDARRITDGQAGDILIKVYVR